MYEQDFEDQFDSESGDYMINLDATADYSNTENWLQEYHAAIMPTIAGRSIRLSATTRIKATSGRLYGYITAEERNRLSTRTSLIRQGKERKNEYQTDLRTPEANVFTYFIRSSAEERDVVRD